MKLLIVNTSTGWGGLEMNVLKLAEALKNNDVETYFITQSNTAFDKHVSTKFKSIFRINNVKKYFDFSNSRRIEKYIKINQIEVVFTAFRPDLDLLCWTKKRVKCLKIIHQQQMQIGIPKKGIFQRMRFNAVDLWLTPLQWLKEELLEKTTLQENKIRLVPLGVKPELFLETPPTKKDSQFYFGFQTDAFVLGVIGRIDEKKGQLFLLECINDLVNQGENIHLLIVGAPTVDNPNSEIYYEKTIDFINQHKLSERIHIAKPTNEIVKFYNAIDLFVMSSEGETYGMVTVEAMFSKTPVIGTNTSGTPEILNYGKRGALYDFNQKKSFISGYSELRKKLQTNSIDLIKIQQEAINLYSFKNEVSGVLSAIQELSN